MPELSQVPSGSFGHSRRPPRGHVRSGNWPQIPTMAEIPAGESEEPAGHHANGHDHHHDDSGHPNGHSHKPDAPEANHAHSHSLSVSHSHGHGHSHSHSHSHSYSHSRSVAGDGSTTYIEGSNAAPMGGGKASDAYTTPFQTSENAPLRSVKYHLATDNMALTSCSYEISTGILTAIPWSVLSWYMRQYTAPTSPKVWRMLKVAASKQKPMNTYSPETAVDAVWWRTLVLASTTMLSIGGIALLRRKRASQSLPNISGLQLSVNSARKGLLRISSLALPIYAGMVIGGTIVALALGLSYAAGVPTVLQLQGQGGKLPEKFSSKKASLFVLSLFLVLHVLGYDFPIDTQPFRGYIALLISIFVLRLPVATPRDSIPAVQKPDIDSVSRLWDGFVVIVSQQASALLSSPLVASSEDIQLTLASGGLLGLLCLLVSPFNMAKTSFGIFDLITTILVAISFAFSFTFSSPMGLRSRQKIGFIATAFVVVFTSAAPHEETSRMAHFSWSILAAFCYFAAFLDDPKPGELTPAKTEVSPVTKFLLQHGESWPILHSILSKEDSRKIFYFMW
jgi:solute carrier family 30 (zinc transporter), member 5/7